METDLYGEEMSSVRQGTDERNSSERRQKQTKACTQIHSCRKWKEKNKIQSFLSMCPWRGHLPAQLRGESGQMCVRCYIPSLMVYKIKA